MLLGLLDFLLDSLFLDERLYEGFLLDDLDLLFILDSLSLSRIGDGDRRLFIGIGDASWRGDNEDFFCTEGDFSTGDSCLKVEIFFSDEVDLLNSPASIDSLRLFVVDEDSLFLSERCLLPDLWESYLSRREGSIFS